MARSVIACSVTRIVGMLVALAATTITRAQETHGTTTVWRPPNVFRAGDPVDRLFDAILYLTCGVLIAVLLCLVVFVVRYRHRPGRRAVFLHGNPRLEVVWTLIPTAIMALIAAFSQASWSALKDPAAMPTGPDVVEVGVVARQFQWFFHYPGPDGRFGRTDVRWRRNTGIGEEEIGLMRGEVEDFMEPGQIEALEADPERAALLDPDPAAADDVVMPVMTIPVDRKVHIRLTSIDVLHSFFVPDFRVKQDAVPGLTGHLWLESDRTSADVIGRDSAGRPKPFDIVCAELCGSNHFKMRGQMFVVTQAEYERWLAANAPEIDEADAG